MPSRRTHDVVATIGKYTHAGEEKKRYANVGSAFTDDQGRISIKLDTVPVSPEWSGFLSLYPVKDRPSEPPAANATHSRRNAQPPRPSTPPEDDDIPF